ncbi:MAG: SulP family inorganic anion transporter [Proteobacteria bacterium]|nr:SulP family inorganic anion transporter [Pseudomonadota bacterium]
MLPPARGDWLAGLSIAGLLLPEAVAYSGLANLPPQAGVMALFAGLLVYGLLGASRFAIVSATSSSATVLAAAVGSLAPVAAGARVALVAAMVLLTGVLFVIAAVARLGAISSLVAKPVLRGFAMGLALTIVIKQLPKLLNVHSTHADLWHLLADLVRLAADWNWACLATGLVALVLLHVLKTRTALPGGLLVIALGIGFDWSGLGSAWNVPRVGPIVLAFDGLQWPDVAREQWLRLGELSFALALILYAESYGSIRTMAIRHGDVTRPNRDLMALGGANLVSALIQGMPVGAGFSGTSANEAAGATSRWAGIVAAGLLGLAAFFALPWIAHTPEPVLAAIVIHAVGHTLNPAALQPYFSWRRDRLVAVMAFVAVLALGVLDGLLLSIGASLLMLLRSLATSRVSWLGRLDDGHNFVDISRHPQAKAPPGLLIARPEEPLFFGNAEGVFVALRDAVGAQPQMQRMVLSLEESPDLDATSIEALCEFAAWMRVRGHGLVLARVKDPVRDLLDRVKSADLPPSAYAAWSVDDAVGASG